MKSRDAIVNSGNTDGYPLVSIVVCSYNHAIHIAKCIRSISEQDYPNFEIIIIDDGSTDSTLSILEQLRTKYQYEIHTKSNGGLVSSINMGIMKARGEYVVFHASDDESLPSRITEQVSVLRRYPDSAFVSGNLRFVTEEGGDRGLLLRPSGNEREMEFEDLFVSQETVSSVAAMYRASALREMVALDEKYRAEDPQIFWRLTSMGWKWVQWAGPPVLNYSLLLSSQSRTIMPLLMRQQCDLVDEFMRHPEYIMVRRRTMAGLFLSLASQNKLQAIMFLYENKLDMRSPLVHRGVLKLCVPYKIQVMLGRYGILGSWYKQLKNRLRASNW